MAPYKYKWKISLKKKKRKRKKLKTAHELWFWIERRNQEEKPDLMPTSLHMVLGVNRQRYKK